MLSLPPLILFVQSVVFMILSFRPLSLAPVSAVALSLHLTRSLRRFDFHRQSCVERRGRPFRRLPARVQVRVSVLVSRCRSVLTVSRRLEVFLADTSQFESNHSKHACPGVYYGQCRTWKHSVLLVARVDEVRVEKMKRFS